MAENIPVVTSHVSSVLGVLQVTYMVVKHVMMPMASSCNVSSKRINELIGTFF